MMLSDLKIISKNRDTLEVFEKKSDQKINSKLYKGDDAIYTSLGKGYGLKIVHAERKSPDRYAYESIEETVKHLRYLQNKNLEIFPTIFDLSSDEKNIYILMEHIENKNTPNEWNNYNWIPAIDKEYLKKNYPVSLKILNKYNTIILENELIPDTSWFKAGHNFIGDKIVDFHRVKYKPGKYYLDAGNKTKEELEKLYDSFLQRYSMMGLNPPKWYRAGIYEGFRFNNGSEFKGYSSDSKEYDSYRKLNFQYLRLAQNSSVLDIGSNQGFFSFQSVIHGAKKVVGIELTKEDYQTAIDINKHIFKFDEIDFINGDAIEYIMNSEEKFDMIVMNSVFHQLYPNFASNGLDMHNFMCKIKSMTQRCMIFETPVNHPKMNKTLSQISAYLKTYFSVARISYVYDAYSPGYRAIFICL